jgi:hypothetical protein
METLRTEKAAVRVKLDYRDSGLTQVFTKRATGRQASYGNALTP